MPAKPRILRVKREVGAPPAAVYLALTTSIGLREWLCDSADVEGRKGGRVYLAWHGGYYAAGEYTALAPDKKVAFTWRGRGEPGPTQVQVTLAVRDGGTLVTLTHRGIGAGRAWAAAAQEFARGWENGLDNLKSVLETGRDLRLVRRPMLGLSDGVELNPKLAAELGVPVTAGIRLGAVVQGMGLEAAGLQRDDVLTSLAGTKLTGWGPLFDAISRHVAGDKVKAVFYRGRARHTAVIELSRRPLPELPPTAESLASAVRGMYAVLDGEVAESLNDVTEAEAERRPAPDEWNIKEVLAHLIVSERDTQFWITTLITGQEPSVAFPDNVRVRVATLAEVAGTAAALLDELRRTEAETVALLAALPAELIARKGSYWRLAYNLLQASAHTREHCVQIRAAVDAARAAA